jgi:hypothetical protein
MEVGGQLHVPAALLQRNKSQVPTEQELGVPQSRSEGFGEVYCLHRELSPDTSVAQFVAYPLYHLRYFPTTSVFPVNLPASAPCSLPSRYQLTN